MTSKSRNKQPPKGSQYESTKAEHIASILTHAIMIPVGILACLVLMAKSTTYDLMVMAIVYGICLITLFTVSTTFHTGSYLHDDPHVIEQLRKSDRAVIYLFIATSYSPWLFLVSFPDDYKLLIHMRWLIWFFAFLGVAFELTISRQYPVFGIVAYIVYGLIPALILDFQMSFPGIAELKFAGTMYFIGIIFFKSEGIIPFAHAIWHVCVIIGAATHYLTVYKSFYSGSLLQSHAPLQREFF